MATATIAGTMNVVPAFVVIMLLSAGTALAACGDDDDPGPRGPDGQCVSWCELEKACGGKAAPKCGRENPSRILLTLWAFAKGDPSLPPCRGCGCKGGPGYRDRDGHCVGWDRLEKTCGSPPTSRCRAEIVDVSAAEVTRAQAAYAEHLRNCRKSP